MDRNGVLSSAYVPLTKNDSETRLNRLWGLLSKENPNLTDYWINNLPFILAEQEEKHAETENQGKDKKPEDTKNDNKDEAKTLVSLLFSDLYKKLKNEQLKKLGRQNDYYSFF